MKLSQLQNSKNIEEFSKKVVKDIKAKLEKEIPTNKGLKDEKELLNLIIKGKNVEFDYNTLIQSSEEL